MTLRPPDRRRGLDLVELRITIAILAVLVAGFSLWRWGFTVKALEGMIGGPIVFLLFCVVLSVAVTGLVFAKALGSGARIERLVRRLEKGDASAEVDAAAVPWGWGVEEAIAKRAARLLPLLDDPRSGLGALRLLLRARDASRIDLDAPLSRLAGAIPPDLMVASFRHAKSDAALRALASSFLGRADDRGRRTILEDLFLSYGIKRLPDEPAAEWAAVLAPWAPQLEALRGPGVVPERIAPWLTAMRG